MANFKHLFDPKKPIVMGGNFDVADDEMAQIKSIGAKRFAGLDENKLLRLYLQQRGEGHQGGLFEAVQQGLGKGKFAKAPEAVTAYNKEQSEAAKKAADAARKAEFYKDPQKKSKQYYILGGNILYEGEERQTRGPAEASTATRILRHDHKTGEPIYGPEKPSQGAPAQQFTDSSNGNKTAMPDQGTSAPWFTPDGKVNPGMEGSLAGKSTAQPAGMFDANGNVLTPGVFEKPVQPQPTGNATADAEAQRQYQEQLRINATNQDKTLRGTDPRYGDTGDQPYYQIPGEDTTQAGNQRDMGYGDVPESAPDGTGNALGNADGPRVPENTSPSFSKEMEPVNEPAANQEYINQLTSSAYGTSLDIGDGSPAEDTFGSGLALDDLTKYQIDLQIKGYNDIASALGQRIQLAQAEFEASKARYEADKVKWGSVLAHKEEMALEANKLASDEAKAKYGTQLAVMRDNNSRLEGYLKAKLASMGALDSGAGLSYLSKAMAMSDLAISEVERDSEHAQRYYNLQGREIMMDYTTKAMQLQDDYNTRIDSLTSNFMGQVAEAQESLVLSETTKNQNIVSIIKDFKKQEVEQKNELFKQKMDLLRFSLDEAKFNQEVVMDAVKADQWEKEFGFSQFQFEANYGLDVAKFEEDKTQFGMNYAMNQQKFAFDMANADRQYALSAAEFEQGVYESDRDYELRVGEFNQAASKAEMDRVQKLVDSGALPASAMNQFMSPEDVITSGEYVSGKYEFNLGDELQKIVQKVTTNPAKLYKSGYQCVQFVRDVVKDLPKGLTSLQDKITKLVKSKYAIPEPEPGAVLVTNDGKFGHVALVTSVNRANNTFTVSEFNYKKGRYGTRTISMNDPKIEGYWKSPKVKSGGGMQQLDVLTGGKATKEQQAAYQRAVEGGYEQEFLNTIKTQSEKPASAESAKVREIANSGLRQLDNLESLIINSSGGIDKHRMITEGPLNTDVKFALDDLTDLIGRLRSGGAINSDEEARFKRLLPNIWDSDETIRGKLAEFRTKFQGVSDGLSGGQNGGTMQVRSPDGTVGTIPSEDWSAAQQEGYTLVN